MKFASFTYDGKHHYGLVNEVKGAVLSLSDKIEFPNEITDFIQDEYAQKKARELLNNWLSETEIGLVYDMNHASFCWQAPIPNPRKNIFAVGRNYLDHAKEMGSSEAPKNPVIFSKATSTVIGHKATVNLHHDVTDAVDYEGELGVIIGKTATRIKKEQALDFVFGFTIINDVTARDLQKKHQQFLLGKSLDTFCPIGPWIVEKNTFLPFEEKRVKTTVNGEERQNGAFSNMIFSVPQLIETLSQGMTLEAGDIIATGTPKGVGKGFNPPKFLKAGDVVEVEIEGIGTLKNVFM
ncbi:fumarylacetoacetate hydrolase family protein [Evansella halocellulosilytica]|uniref:fumarylacetoacetate hydrolase family protein n=1 Tax=Evansella halocellulosilytica TaxID=2011013 RepID=UPI000BB9ABDC|nr:fumarylacetoacetate hydrolase family protein [Evansella halocellulosilytica]